MVSVRRSTVLVWVVYAIGLCAAAVVVLSAAVAVVVSNSSDDDEFAFHVSTPVLIGWCGIIAVAAGTWIWRRSRGRR